MLPVRDDEHQQLFDYSKRIANICLSEAFTTLKKELEKFYRGGENEDTTFARIAFQDALYALIAEEDLEFGKPLALFGEG